MTRTAPPTAKTPPPPPGRATEAAARLAEAAWWPGDKPGALWSAKGDLPPYQPSTLAWVLTILAGFVIGWACGPLVPLP